VSYIDQPDNGPRVVIAVYCEDHMIHNNATFGQNAEIYANIMLSIAEVHKAYVLGYESEYDDFNIDLFAFKIATTL
jgi:hypothetical protein